MGYVICKLQNVSGWSNEKPDVMIDDTHPDWDEILKRWASGKPPTDSKFWKKGVIACTKVKDR